MTESSTDPLVAVLATIKTAASPKIRTPTVFIAIAILLFGVGIAAPPLRPILWLPGIVVFLVLLYTAIHELGHLSVAWVAGFRIYMFVVGPLAIVRNGRDIQIRHNTSLAFAGCVVSAPHDPANQRVWLTVYAAAGAIANIMFGGIVLAGYLLFPLAPEVKVLASAVIGMSFASIVNLIPYRIGAFGSDGHNIITLYRPGPLRDRLVASWAILALAAGQQRPRDWDGLILETLLAPTDGSSMDAGACYFAYLHHLDSGREEDAAIFIERAISQLGGMPLLFSAEYYAEAVYFFVRRGSNRTLARDILNRLSKANISDTTRYRAEAATLLAEGNTLLATETATRAIAIADDCSDSGIVEAERDLLIRLLAEAESARSPIPISQSEVRRKGDVAPSPVA